MHEFQTRFLAFDFALKLLYNLTRSGKSNYKLDLCITNDALPLGNQQIFAFASLPTSSPC